jgi:glycerol-1-phosphate dehydrogenase [NAD(P)+]
MEGFAFVDGHFQHQDWVCTCGREHSVPIREIVVKSGALNDLAGVMDRLNIGRHGLLVADFNTYAVAGERVWELLGNAGYTLKLSLFETREPLHADEHALGKVLFDVEPGRTAFLLVVGSGSLTDIARMISSRTGIPFVSVATAASMDGYASPVAPLVIGGIKTTIPASVPVAIVADTDVLCAAPYAMTAAGFGDLLGKYNSRTDWRLAQIVTGEYHCQQVEDLVNQVVDDCVGQAAQLRQQTPEAIEGLTQGLILSGLGMLAVGSSRPASGAEHSLSHYWEIMALLRQRPAHFHGTKVGIGTAIMAKVYAKFFASDPHAVDLDDIKRRKVSFEAWQQEIRAVFGPAAARVIAIQTPFFLDWEAQQRTIATVQAKWAEIQALRPLELSYDQVAAILTTAGAPVEPQDIGIDADYVRETLRYAKEVRPQYTVFSVIDALGWLDEFVEEIAADYA